MLLSGKYIGGFNDPERPVIFERIGKSGNARNNWGSETEQVHVPQINLRVSEDCV